MLIRSRSRNTGHGRRAYGSPLLYAQQYGLLLWLRADMGIQYGATMRPGGTAPPAWTLSGTATRLVNIQANIDNVGGGTGLGQATYRWRENETAAYTNGVVTAAGPTALGTTGLSVAMAAGPYNIDNTWLSTVAQWNDQSGLGNHAVQATAANQPTFLVAGFGGYPAIDMGVGNRGLTVASLTFGPHTMVGALRGDALTAFVVRHYNGASRGHVYGSTGDSSSVIRVSTTGKDVSVSWLRDGVRKTFGKTFNGNHADHLVYVNGVDQNAATGSASANPGTSTVAGQLFVGNYEGLNSGLRGLFRELVVYSSAVPPSVMLAIHRGMATRAAGAL